jgi:hypothetical protein
MKTYREGDQTHEVKDEWRTEQIEAIDYAASVPIGRQRLEMLRYVADVLLQDHYGHSLGIVTSREEIAKKCLGPDWQTRLAELLAVVVP